MSVTKDIRPVLRVGDLAYWDSFAGMIPCKVLSITGKSGAAGTNQYVKMRFTAPRGNYKRGETRVDFGHHVVPRAAYFKRRHGSKIGYYTVEVS